MTSITARKGLGKVFLSHSSQDKAFVRRLATTLQKAGFDTWLDEKELVAGDSLPHRISDALSTARAVIVVISPASVVSNWVRYEVRSAATRMITGHCRLIPVLIGDIDPPDELTGLLCVDSRPGRRGGMAKVIEALEAEASKFHDRLETLDSDETSIRRRGIERLLSDIFGGRGFASMDVSATRTIDWDIVSFEFGDREWDVVVDDVMYYGGSNSELTDNDWTDWANRVVDDISERFGLLISERAPSPTLRTRLSNFDTGVYVEPLPAKLFEPSGLLVLVDLSDRPSDQDGRRRLVAARTALTSAAQEQEPAPLQTVREQLNRENGQS